MSKGTRFRPEEVAAYIIDRMRKERAIKPGQAKGGLKDALARAVSGAVTAGDTEHNALEFEERIAEVRELALEKEDTVRQIASDGALLAHGKKSISQDEVLETLDDMEMDEETLLRAVTGSLRATQGIEDSIHEAGLLLQEIISRLDGLLSDPAVTYAYGARLTRQIGVIRKARTVGDLRKLTEQCDLARMELFARRSSENMALTRADSEIIRKYDLIAAKAKERTDGLMGKDDVYYEAKRRVLLEYRRQLLSDGFVETPGVLQEMLKIISHLSLGIPVLLRGHLGAGKTEVALHVSRKYLGHEPEFISGSEEATKYDIYGRTQIGGRPEEEKMREFRSRMEEYMKMNPTAGKKEIKEAELQYYQTIVVKGLTTSFFQYGPLVRAMREGRPLLIDEMDGIPHSIIMRLNHVLTRRPGDHIRIQEGTGEQFIVKNGFCVLATGNIKSFRYKREELDAAFLSRWWSLDITYPPQDETYEILVASLLDRRGDLQVKNMGDLDELKKLTQAAAEIQRIFSGEHLDYFGEGADAARQVPASLKKSVLSLRHLWNIVRPWKAHNFDKPLEAYIMNEFIKPSVAEDQIYLVQLFCRFRFYKTWTARDFAIPGLTDGKLAAFQGKGAGHANV